MHEYVLKAKSWQIFLTIVTPIIILNFIPDFDPIVFKTKSVIIFSTYWIWLFLVGDALHVYLPRRVSISDTFFKVNIFVVIMFYGIATILMEPNTVYTFSGLWGLVYLYFIFAIVKVSLYLGKLMTSIEVKKEADFDQYLGKSILFLFGIVGVFWLQPKINEIYSTED